MPQEKGTIVIEKAVSQKKRHMVAGGEWGEGVTQEAPGLAGDKVGKQARNIMGGLVRRNRHGRESTLS